MRGSLATLERLTLHFPEDTAAKNQLGVAHLLLGDNKAAKTVYEEVGEEHLLLLLLHFQLFL